MTASIGEREPTRAELNTVGPYKRPTREIGGLGIAAALHSSIRCPVAYRPTLQDAHEAAYEGFPAVQALSVVEQC